MFFIERCDAFDFLDALLSVFHPSPLFVDVLEEDSVFFWFVLIVNDDLHDVCVMLTMEAEYVYR